MSAPVEISGGGRSRGGRRSTPRGHAVSSSASHTGGGDSPALSTSRWSLSSNRDSGYIPSPAGVVRFDWDNADAEEADPSTPGVVRRVATRPIAIPGGGGGLQMPAESVLLRRRRRQCRTLSTDSSDCEGDLAALTDADGATCQQAVDWERSGIGDGDHAKEVEGEKEDEIDHQRVRKAEVPTMHMTWSDTVLMSSEVNPNEPADDSARRQAVHRLSLSEDDSVERDVGQELREIADNLPLSRSAPGDLQPRRNIWTLLRRTISFRIGSEVAAPPRRPEY